MNILRASVDDPEPTKAGDLSPIPPIPRTPSELRVAAELRTGDDELMVTRVRKAHVATALGLSDWRAGYSSARRPWHAPCLRRPWSAYGANQHEEFRRAGI